MEGYVNFQKDPWDIYYELMDILENSYILMNRNRVNVTGLSHINYRQSPVTNAKQKKYEKVGFPIQSQNFGLVKNRNATADKRYIPSKNNTRHPELYQKLKELIEIIDPDFEYTTITLNKNVLCKPHYDANNLSPSIIISLGDFSGGELNVEGKKYDIKMRPLKFNGSKLKHWTEPFQGDRYSFIYYKN